MSQIIGFAAEEQAHQFLLKQGLQSVSCNYHSRFGEIDLIMRDGNYLVFVEVRARTSNFYGGALASVTPRKRQKLIKTASLYLLENKRREQPPIRFDVVGLDGNPVKINWIKNAFGVDF